MHLVQHLLHLPRDLRALGTLAVGVGGEFGITGTFNDLRLLQPTIGSPQKKVKLLGCFHTCLMRQTTLEWLEMRERKKQDKNNIYIYI